MPATDYIILIHRYLTGEISTEDQKLLEAWLSAAPENQQAYEEIKQIWESTNDEKEITEEHFKGEMEKLESAVQESVRKDNMIKTYQRNNRVRNMALVAMVIVTGFCIALPLLKIDPVNTVTFSNDQNKELVLSDSSRILLNKNSSITYSSSASLRQVKLIGEAMFDVKKERRPFQVSASNVIVDVVGTAFIVKVYSDSLVEIFVISGLVEVKYQDKTIKLARGEKFLTGKAGSLKKIMNGNPNFNSWYTRELVFKNTELEDILPLLEELYNISFLMDEKRILNCRFTGKFDNAKLEDVLKTLSYSMDIKFTSQIGNYYQVSGRGCVP
ncbi:FecR family protein [Ohtaekwangia koreensis]|uniref:FecR family protein n=1 Tax=Ohtaekwangia koreensis TaxID=688867 RepID=A0A1T5MA38_9BACT|nr:FecR domain-containing protein [Ohtaekwangia koreensis]SKC85005.1 FecR family protein [Ohtaekwangia koreensis]